MVTRFKIGRIGHPAEFGTLLTVAGRQRRDAVRTLRRGGKRVRRLRGQTGRRGRANGRDRGRDPRPVLGRRGVRAAGLRVSVISSHKMAIQAISHRPFRTEGAKRPAGPARFTRGRAAVARLGAAADQG